MNDRVAVTLSSAALRQPRDLVLPLDAPLYLLVEGICEALEIQVPERSRGMLSVMVDRKKTMLPWQGTLRGMGVSCGQYLHLDFQEISARGILVCLPGPKFELDKDEMTLGCRSSVDIDLRSIPHQEFVSGVHARISWRGGSHFLRDLNSTNGTSVNGQSLTAGEDHLLKDGDTILLGDSEKSGIRLLYKFKQ